MSSRRDSALDAIVIGSGPNGLAAAIALARAGRSVRVYEAADTIGGATRSASLTLPGYIHDICSTVHALAQASPFLRTLPLAEHGLELVQPEAPLAHPLDDGTAVVVERSLEATAESLGAERWSALPVASRALRRPCGRSDGCDPRSGRAETSAIDGALWYARDPPGNGACHGCL